MSMLAATQLTAVATLVLAVGAIITAFLAGFAFRKQSDEVRLLAKQLEDQEALTRQQAQAIGLQSEQLALNRQQLAEQHRDLSQRERLLERQQANSVDLQVWPSKNLPDQPASCMALVINRSNRPIRLVRCRIKLEGEQELHIMTWLGVRVVHDAGSPRLGTWDPFSGDSGGMPIMRAASTHGFEFNFGHDPQPSWEISTRFVDDSGIGWQIDPDLHLDKLEDHPTW